MNPQGRPQASEYPTFYHGYVASAPGTDLFSALGHGAANFEGLDPEDETFAMHRYSPGKWSVKEVVQHVIDAERVFSYRALRFARQDGTALPGFDENAYAHTSQADQRTLHDLLAEAVVVRAASVALFHSFTPYMLGLAGTANGRPITVNALGWVIAGHAAHHLRIIHERYH